MHELNNADMLYLPLAFTYAESKKPQMMTCFGAKVFDYMQASVPILIHAPDDVFNYTFFEKNKAAFLLNSLDKEIIKSELDLIMDELNSARCKEIVSNANALAKKFDGKLVSDDFLNTLQ
jgi:hypothetical protein